MEERTSTTDEVRPGPELPTGAQIPLPFDDEAEQPIPFALTARARRTVAPDALPSLRVIRRAAASDGAPAVEGELGDDPSDTRPARARALRRAGVARGTIASQLGVDELLVRAWTADVAPSPRHPGAAGGRVAPGAGMVVDGSAAVAAERVEVPTARLEERATARQQAVVRLREEPHLAGGLGVLAGIADVGGRDVTIVTADPRAAGRAVRWLVEVLGADPSEVRVVLRVAPRAAADLARHRWGQALGVDPGRIRTTRSARPGGDTDVEGVVRLAGAALSASVAGWCDALLEGDGEGPVF